MGNKKMPIDKEKMENIRNKWIAILVLDPGVTTGYAIFTKGRKHHHWSLFEIGKLSDCFRFDDMFPRVDAIVYENVVSPGLHFNDYPIRVIGVIQYLAEKYNIPTIKQQPSSMQAPLRWAAPWFRLQKISEHEKDAICHGMFFLGMENLNPCYFIKENNDI